MLIKKYTPDWIKDFETLRQEISHALKGLNFKIEQVGSTAVPELEAKPIIDIDIVYFEQATFNKIKTALLAAGYYHNGAQGIADREVFKREDKGLNTPLNHIAHHLYACSSKSDELVQHLLFRDHLRENKAATIAYQDLKYKIALAAKQDKKLYAMLKIVQAKDFVNDIINIEKKFQKQ